MASALVQPCRDERNSLKKPGYLMITGLFCVRASPHDGKRLIIGLRENLGNRFK